MRVLGFVVSATTLFIFNALFSSDPKPPPILVNVTNGSFIEEIDLPCEQAYAGNKSAINALKLVQLDLSSLHGALLENDTSTCDLIRTSFGFDKSPSSAEEREFPLAFTVLAHNRPEQLLLMLASFFESHNSYCVAFPSNADEDFKRIILPVAGCFSNIHVIEVGHIEWGSFEILNANYKCMEMLVEMRPQVQWKYVQFMSGVAVPLRTNLEMVHILKQWDGLAHTHVDHYKEWERILTQANKTKPMRLFKSFLAAIIPSGAAEKMVKDPRAKELFEFLRPTMIADESYWTSALGNPDVFPIPGGFNASGFLEFKSRAKSENPNGFPVKKCSHAPCISTGFVARYSTWQTLNEPCQGYWKSESCVFGVGDLPEFRSSASFTAHKLYIEYQPAAFICAIKEANRLRKTPDTKFDSVQYNELPLLEFARGVPYENLTRADLLESS